MKRDKFFLNSFKHTLYSWQESISNEQKEIIFSFNPKLIDESKYLSHDF